MLKNYLVTGHSVLDMSRTVLEKLESLCMDKGGQFKFKFTS